jgi:hypothetical protein
MQFGFDHVWGLSRVNADKFSLTQPVIDWCQTVLGYEPRLELIWDRDENGNRTNVQTYIGFTNEDDYVLFQLNYANHFTLPKRVTP